ncbi:MAG: hypothetical protein GTN62_13820 [Gemmatimonadales bacterium]|nr:hypothetical protein [Gemmatimonadales bacterium]NIN13081.1 hypothetical protein [Gemmatimonadales bacterium]NIN51165.1 hypothetical protein [Gemmatimonadales bacterium]NIP08629.1 hypothetical protein [Gemmatimonadales bacterium]NIS66111.1 hypothetical protein [Gemmatimonadales bacterium]
MTPGAAGLGLVLLALPHSAVAQDSLRLQFSPVRGVRIHRVFQAHTRTTVSRVDSAGAMQTSTRETAELGGMTQVALEGPDGGLVVHLTFDSLRARMREGGERWRERQVGQPDSLWIQVRIDRRMRVLGTNAGGDAPGAKLLVPLLTGVPGLVLPEQWVKAGDRWTARLEVPLDAFGGRPPTIAYVPTLAGRTTFAVDSVIARARDTLAYVEFAGAFAPKKVADAHGTALSYSGGVQGALVWSTGWGAWVSAATRLRVVVSMAGAGATPGPTRGRITVETTIRESVRQ